MDYLNHLWQIFSVAMIPLIELRGAIPVGIGLYHITPLLVLAVAVIGNLVPVILILLYLERLTNWLRSKHILIDRFFSWLFAHTFHQHSAKFDRWGSLALLIFVAIPLPFTGAWTGALLAYLFGIKFKYAFLYITGGVILAGLIVTLATLGGVWALSL